MGSDLHLSAAGATELLDSRAHAWNTIFSFVRSRSLDCAVELGVFNAIHSHSGRPVTITKLLDELSLPLSRADDLARLMRILEHEGYFAAAKPAAPAEEKAFVLTPPGELVRERAGFLATMVADPALSMPWFHLSSWFRTDEPTPFHAMHGMNLWEYTSRTPEFSRKFNAGMTYDSDQVVGAIVANCGPVLDGAHSLVDVGGNNGAMARAISDAFPALKCIVYDLPHVVAEQKSTERLQFMAGNMFDSVPQADVALIKHVLHDYNEEDCVKIMKECKKAIKGKEEGGKVVVIDMVLGVVVKKGDHEMIENQLFMDMVMMTQNGGKEREEEEWGKIFLGAGFSTYQITPILDIYCLIEVFP